MNVRFALALDVAAIAAAFLGAVALAADPPAQPSYPHDVPKNRYISFMPGNAGVSVAIQIELIASDVFPDAAGVIGWVGEPVDLGCPYPEDPPEDCLGEYVANLDCLEPVYRVWDADDVLHVGDLGIVPVSTYAVRVLAAGDGEELSEPLIISTISQPTPHYWGDVVGVKDPVTLLWNAPDGLVNINDVQGAVLCNEGKPNSPHKVWIDVHGPTPNHIINITDIQFILLAAEGNPYPWGLATPDCNENGVPDKCDPDCQAEGMPGYGIPDDCDVDPTDPDHDGHTSPDCNLNIIPDECEDDCNANGVPDDCDIDTMDPDGNWDVSWDCNANGVPDECDIDVLDPDENGEVSGDCNVNTIPDECEIDEVAGPEYFCDPADPPVGLDECDPDCNQNETPDACDEDCQPNDIPDNCEIDENSPAPGGPYFCTADCDPDCNDNGNPDECDLSQAISPDCNSNAIPDECDIVDCAGSVSCQDCNGNGIPDGCDIEDCVPGDADCDDCNINGVPDWCDIGFCDGANWCQDCTGDGVPNRCEPDCDDDDIPDACVIADCSGDLDCADCDGNLIPDGCDLAACVPGNPNCADCNVNGVLDECDISACLPDDPSCADCNGNSVPDTCDLSACVPGDPTCDDCDGNSVPDSCDIAACDASPSCQDCNVNNIPDGCELDCQGNGVPDDCDIDPTDPDGNELVSQDCNGNLVPDECDVVPLGSYVDCNVNIIPDVCEIDENSTAPGGPFFCTADCDPDCNENGVPDACDLASGPSADCQPNGIPDECEIDGNSGASGGPYFCDPADPPAGLGECDPDCNANGEPDACETDCQPLGDPGHGIPDECDVDPADPDGDGWTSQDCGWGEWSNGIPDECEADCDNDDTPDSCVLATCAGDPACDDCNSNSIPDACDIDDCDGSLWCQDCNTNGIPDECEPDCDEDGVPDECEIADCGALDPDCADCNSNGIPDECDIAGWEYVDCNGNSIPDVCDIADDPVAHKDTDGDRILDECETDTGVFSSISDTGTDPYDAHSDGMGIDNGDGINDGDEVFGTVDGLDLSSMGANPNRKNLFIETDWFDDSEGTEPVVHTHRPSEAAIAVLQAAFNNAPIDNRDPGYSGGIELIVDYGQGGAFTGGEEIPGNDTVVVVDGFVSTSEFYASYKNHYFASNRQGYFRYCILAHHYNNAGNTSSGIAEIFGDDFMVTLQDQADRDDAYIVAGVVMHEFGHTLGLRHGGGENKNYKPNYNSVMNYRYEFSGIDDDCDAWGDGSIDYSSGLLDDLDEEHLDENVGICGSGFPIDWDGGGLSSDTDHNINCKEGNSADCGVATGQTCGDDICDVLSDHDDWDTISLPIAISGRLIQEVIECQSVPPRSPAASKAHK
ncbi:MAG: hypothetical protein JSU63_14015 [Phycisphaerales bacterium]|nr:MAG: hypothetical protein JSU63_14015 [Phycisphaerales bacterium]